MLNCNYGLELGALKGLVFGSSAISKCIVSQTSNTQAKELDSIRDPATGRGREMIDKKLAS